MTETPESVARALQVVVAANVAAVERALAHKQLDEPAYALGMPPSQEDGDLAAGPLLIGVTSVRERALAQDSAYQAFRDAWDVWRFTREAEATVEETSVWQEASELIAGHFADRDEIANRVVLSAVGRALTERPPLSPVTDDFLVYAFDEDYGEDLLVNLHAAAPERVARLLRARGLLPDSIDEYEDARMF